MKKNGILFALVAIAALSAGAVDAAKSGALLLSFDDRNFGDWEGAIGLFDKYGARATFFCCGEIDTNAVRVLKKLQDRGHSIGLHGRGHLNANEAVAEKGADGYWADEIEPQLAECRTAGIKVASFAYPNCRRTDETDALFKAKGFAHVRGGLKGVAPYDPDGVRQAGLKPVHMVDRAFFPASELKSRFRFDTVLAGEDYHTDIEDILACIRRCAERNEAFVLASHGISPDATHIHMKTEWLERILATAKECGVPCLGFDECCASPDAEVTVAIDSGAFRPPAVPLSRSNRISACGARRTGCMTPIPSTGPARSSR